MIRITKEALDELIEHQGELKHGPLNSVGVCRLALDLRDARARIAELESALEEECDALEEERASHD